VIVEGSLASATMAGYAVAGAAVGSSLAGALGCSLAGALGSSLAGALGTSLAAAVGVAAVVGAALGAVDDGAADAAVDARGLAVGPAAGVHAMMTNIATSPAVANVSHLGLWDMRVIPPLFTCSAPMRTPWAAAQSRIETPRARCGGRRS